MQRVRDHSWTYALSPRRQYSEQRAIHRNQNHGFRSLVKVAYAEDRRGKQYAHGNVAFQPDVAS